MDREQRGDRFVEAEDRLAGYEVYDPSGEKIGKVYDLFLDESDSPEYNGVKMNFFGLRSTLVLWEIVRVDEERGAVEVSAEKERVKSAPSFDDDQEITLEQKREVYDYFGVEHTETDGDWAATERTTAPRPRRPPARAAPGRGDG